MLLGLLRAVVGGSVVVEEAVERNDNPMSGYLYRNSYRNSVRDDGDCGVSET